MRLLLDEESPEEVKKWWKGAGGLEAVGEEDLGKEGRRGDRVGVSGWVGLSGRMGKVIDGWMGLIIQAADRQLHAYLVEFAESILSRCKGLGRIEDMADELSVYVYVWSE